jgi:triacylglycerol lipase
MALLKLLRPSPAGPNPSQTISEEQSPYRLKNPIVLVHGLGAKKQMGPLAYFRSLPQFLRRHGNTVFLADLTSWHSVEWRARELRSQIESQFPSGPINLVGHSMGGLDARWLTSKLDFSHRVASVTTIGTPHRGSLLGDLVLGQISQKNFHKLEKVAKNFGLSHEGLRQLSKENCLREITDQAPDMPGVKYFSATTSIKTPLFRNALPLFWLPSRIIQDIEGDNDGFVSLQSATWGEHICTDVGDHYAQIDHGVPYYLNSFNAIEFYEKIFVRLAQAGV